MTQVTQVTQVTQPASEVFGTLHVEHASTVDRVAGELRRAILEGELESGTALREVALAASLGVSRPTVREALTTLVAEALVTREPNRGVSVARPEADSVRDLCRCRLVLEGAGIRHWAHADPERRAEVRRTLDEYIDAVDAAASYPELNQRHLTFHVSLVGLTGSPRLVAMQEALVTELRLALAQVERLHRNAHDQADSHAALVRLLEAGDLDRAHAFLVRHLADAEEEIIEALELGPGPAAVNPAAVDPAAANPIGTLDDVR